MDLGIRGRTAIVCASSAGLGLACAEELAAAGCNLVMNGRNAAALAKAAAAIRAAHGVTVTEVAGDVGTPDVQDALIAAAPVCDILVNNNGGPPPRDFRQVDRAALEAGIAANMATPIALVQRVIGGMTARGWGRIVCITSASVKAPLPGLDLSSGARLGLTGFLAGVARQVAPDGVTINFLLPGAFDTRRIAALHAATAARTGKSADEVRDAALAANPTRRLGRPEEFGAACAFLCSVHAGYITGQSLLMDGGAFPGTL
jgi:3-oxoacyl-[acyl-carrier protein] reductase